MRRAVCFCFGGALPSSSSICRINGRNTSSFGFGLCFACRYPGGSSCARIFFRVCQPTLYFAIAARLLKAPVSTSRRISLQISMSLCTPVPLSVGGCGRGYRPDPPLPENCTVVRRHFGPPRHGPRAAVFDRRQQVWAAGLGFGSATEPHARLSPPAPMRSAANTLPPFYTSVCRDHGWDVARRRCGL